MRCGARVTALGAERWPAVTARFLERYLAEAADATIDDTAIVATLLAALGGPRHKHALRSVLDMLERA